MCFGASVQLTDESLGLQSTPCPHAGTKGRLSRPTQWARIAPRQQLMATPAGVLLWALRTYRGLRYRKCRCRFNATSVTCLSRITRYFVRLTHLGQGRMCCNMRLEQATRMSFMHQLHRPYSRKSSVRRSSACNDPAMCTCPRFRPRALASSLRMHPVANLS